VKGGLLLEKNVYMDDFWVKVSENVFIF